MAAGCLLYTDPINSAPHVTISPPTKIYIGQPAVFTAEASDPDGSPDSLKVTWFLVERSCAMAGSLWTAGPAAEGKAFSYTPRTRDSICIKARVEDPQGAATESAPRDLKPENQPPIARLVVEAPASARARLYSTAQISGAGSQDPDNDVLKYVFHVRRPDETTVEPGGCADRSADPRIRCFEVEKAGPYVVTLIVSDGAAESAPASVTVNADEDLPPCISTEGVDPDPVRTPLVILPAEGPPRQFEIKRVFDDGHPLPPGPRGRTSFVWYVSQGRGWERLAGYDRPEREIGPFLFDDVRPGKSFGVRVVAQDPDRAQPPAIRALEESCKDRDLCEEPKGCLRWISWTVRFQ